MRFKMKTIISIVITLSLLSSTLSGGITQNFGHKKSATGRGEVRGTKAVFRTTREGVKIFEHTSVRIWMLSVGEMTVILRKQLTADQQRKILGKYRKIIIRNGEIVGAKKN